MKGIRGSSDGKFGELSWTLGCMLMPYQDGAKSNDLWVALYHNIIASTGGPTYQQGIDINSSFCFNDGYKIILVNPHLGIRLRLDLHCNSSRFSVMIIQTFY